MHRIALITIKKVCCMGVIFLKMMDRIANLLMPIEEVEEIEMPVENVSAQQTVADDMKQRHFTEEQPITEKAVPPKTSLKPSSTSNGRAHLSVHTNKMNIQVFEINAFDEVKRAADALKSKQAVVLNYEKVDTETQKRMCDFLNGVCYVLEGEVKRVSDTMVLYVPDDMTISNGIVRGSDGIFKKDMAS